MNIPLTDRHSVYSNKAKSFECSLHIENSFKVYVYAITEIVRFYTDSKLFVNVPWNIKSLVLCNNMHYFCENPKTFAKSGDYIVFTLV